MEARIRLADIPPRMLRRTQLRRGKANDKRPLLKSLDTLARKLTFTRAEHRCERCGSRDHLQWHHVYSRAIISLRWDLDNLVVLCGGCHLWWHHNPLDAAAWFGAYVMQGPDPARGKRLLLARRTRRKTDMMALKLMLERQVQGKTP